MRLPAPGLYSSGSHSLRLHVTDVQKHSSMSPLVERSAAVPHRGAPGYRHIDRDEFGQMMKTGGPHLDDRKPDAGRAELDEDQGGICSRSEIPPGPPGSGERRGPLGRALSLQPQQAVAAAAFVHASPSITCVPLPLPRSFLGAPRRTSAMPRSCGRPRTTSWRMRR